MQRALGANMSDSINPLQKKIGIIGGGQLGKMMILDAKRLGYYVITLDPTPDCPSSSITDQLIVARFDDLEAMRVMANQVDVITYEFEHIGVQALKQLTLEGHTIYPTPSSLEIIQDKAFQKDALAEAGLPIPEFHQVETIEDIYEAAESYGYPLMLKACTGGYDGKGNALIRANMDVISAFESLGSGQIKLMAERFVPFKLEISVLACRGIDGNMVVYPVAENQHVNSILDTTIVPAHISDTCTKNAMALAESVMDVFHGVGMFCVEMFVTTDEEVLINEVAPRPHNSGHYTIEACFTSQFENHIRAIVGLPLGDVALRTPTVMRNLLGAPNVTGTTITEGIDEAYKLPQVKVHLYGKSTTKPFRKMGHLTAIGITVEAAKKLADEAYDLITITSNARK